MIGGHKGWVTDNMLQSQNLISTANQPSPQDPNSYKTPEEPTSGKADTRFNFSASLTKSGSKSNKKKRGKRKKKKHPDLIEENTGIGKTTCTSVNN